MSDLRGIVKELLAVTTVFVLLFFVFGSLYFLMTGWVPLHFLPSALPFAAMYALRRWVTVRWAFNLWHLVLVLLGVLVLGWSNAWAWILMVILALVSFGLRTKGGTDPSVVSAIATTLLSAAAFVIIALVGIGPIAEMQMFLGVLATINLSAHILYIQMANLDNSLVLAREIGGVHGGSGSVLQANNRLVGFFIGAMVLLGSLTALGLGGLLLRTIRTLQRLFSRENAEPLSIEGLFEQVLYLGELELYEEYLEEPTLIIGALAEFDEIPLSAVETLFFILAIPTLLLIVWIFWYIFSYYFNRRYGKKQQVHAGDETESLSGSLLADLQSLLRRREKLHPTRREYYKKITRHMRRGIAIFHHNTTAQISEKIRPTEDINELTARYEQVRYGKGQPR